MKTLLYWLMIIALIQAAGTFALVSYIYALREQIKSDLHEFEVMVKTRINGFLDVFKRSRGGRE